MKLKALYVLLLLLLIISLLFHSVRRRRHIIRRAGLRRRELLLELRLGRHQGNGRVHRRRFRGESRLAVEPEDCELLFRLYRRLGRLCHRRFRRRRLLLCLLLSRGFRHRRLRHLHCRQRRHRRLRRRFRRRLGCLYRLRPSHPVSRCLLPLGDSRLRLHVRLRLRPGRHLLRSPGRHGVVLGNGPLLLRALSPRATLLHRQLRLPRCTRSLAHGANLDCRIGRAHRGGPSSGVRRGRLALGGAVRRAPSRFSYGDLGDWFILV